VLVTTPRASHSSMEALALARCSAL
jgi:hypothetical protein